MKTRRLLGVLALVALLPLQAQTTSPSREAPPAPEINRDSLIADFDYFTNLLETSHPDPYSGFGGKVSFHKKAWEVRNELYRHPCTLQAFWDKTMAFLSPLQDSHTSLDPLENSSDDTLCLPVGFTCFSDGLIAEMLPVAHKDLLGSRLVGINDKSMSQLLSLTAEKYACENKYDRYYKLYNQLPSVRFIRQLFPDGQDSVCFHLLTPRQETVAFKWPLTGSHAGRDVETARLPVSTSYPAGPLNYGFIDENKQVMLFKAASIQARDNFEFMYQNGWNFYSQLANFYKHVLKKEMPEDTIKAIRDLPSFSETFARLLNEMKKEKAPDLIIDLRGNGGGWTPITLPTLYQLFGDRYLQTDMNTKYYRLISPLYLQKIGKTLEEFNRQAQHTYHYGDYTFDDVQPRQMPIDTLRSQFVANCLSCVKEELQRQQGKPLYTPAHIYVVTDDKTFSAAFHYAFYLWKMGATVVGVPSRQAPNSYMEQTSFQLPYTRLSGSISNSIQIFLPEKDKRAKIFFPDLTLTYEDYRKYDFDQQSEIKFLLEHIRSRDRSPGPASPAVK